MFSSLRLFSVVSALVALQLVAAGPVDVEARQSVSPNHFSGRATYYQPGLGACGYTNTASQAVVAVNTDQFGSGYPGPHCGHYVVLENTQNGKTAVAEVVDKCPGCGYGGLDLSPSLFQQLAVGGLNEGVFPVIWNFQ